MDKEGADGRDEMWMRAEPPPRPRIDDDPGMLGISRMSRGRFGSRVFTLFFVLVFLVILVQLVASLLNPL